MKIYQALIYTATVFGFGLLIGLLSGCASMQNKWQGKEINTVLDKYGIPNDRISTQDGEVWQYVDRCGGFTTKGPVVYGQPQMIGSTFNSCRVTNFRIKDGFVVSAKQSWK